LRRKTNEAKTVPLEVTYTEGYQERFTKLVLKIYEKRRRENRIGAFETAKKLEEKEQQQKTAV